MTKLEKAIKGLECCITESADMLFAPSCEKCPYKDEEGTCSTLDALHRGALELLKKQEPQPAIIEDFGVAQLGRCPSCNVVLLPWGANYCHKCGKAVKWDD